MKGRSARILISGKEVGQMGEIDPVVGDHFELRVPMHAAEFDIEALRQAIRDPVL
jgi:phenylalanyl-tRNA synthetase beta subunit